MPFFARRKLTDSYDQAVHIKEVDLKNEKSFDFYCPCDKCSCRMHIRNGRNGDGRTHFFKLSSDEHSKNCWMPNDRKNESRSLTAEGLVFGEYMDNLKKPETHNPASSNTRSNLSSPKNESDHSDPVPIKTIRQLYLYCSNHSDNDFLGIAAEGERQLRVLDIFAGRKTRYYYKDYFSGNKLVEAQYVKTLTNSRTKLKSLLFAYPFAAKEGEDVILFKVRFNNTALANRMAKRVEGEMRPILVCTYWHRSRENNDIYGYIDSGKQIRVFRE